MAKLIIGIPMKGKEEFLTIKQTSECLGVPLRTVYRLAGQGKIRAIRIGGKIRCLKSNIEKHYTFGTDFPIEPVRKNPQFIERRTFPRINSNFICQYSISLSPFKNINNKGIIRNLCAGGVLVIHKNTGKEKIDIDDPIKIEFTLFSDNNQKSVISADGRVVRKGLGEAGVKFKNIDCETKTRIIEYVG